MRLVKVVCRLSLNFVYVLGFIISIEKGKSSAILRFNCLISYQIVCELIRLNVLNVNREVCVQDLKIYQFSTVGNGKLLPDKRQK